VCRGNGNAAAVYGVKRLHNKLNNQGVYISGFFDVGLQFLTE
jgi:hypothetical protein